MYQPLNVDRERSQDTWSRDIYQLQQLGINRLLVQWTRHDDSEFAAAGPDDHGHWLMQRLRYAERTGISVVIGLSADSRYFDYINQTFDETYWYQYLNDNIGWAGRLQGLVDKYELHAEGYYFPGELSDHVLADAQSLSYIIEGLSALQTAVNAPLYISTFYTGHSPVADYLNAIERLQENGIVVLHQDGAGSRALTKNQVDEVLSTLGCRAPVIEELFVEQSDGQIRAVAGEIVSAKLEKNYDCRTRYLFSLRYLVRWQQPSR